jgi:hypothetical protein
MKTIKDTELKYINGEPILEGDNVELEYMRIGGGVMPDKVEGVIEYKNGAFYIVGKDFEKTIASILENNDQVPYKYPMNIIKKSNN